MILADVLCIVNSPIYTAKNYIEDFCHYRRYFGHEFRKKFAIWFSENEGGGSNAVWFFSKNSSVLEVRGFPNSDIDCDCDHDYSKTALTDVQ